ncbi:MULTISPECIES: uridine phosphorylase [unclassified Ruminococcus]|uniref:uridine phosphorylase n=1 Tax=unclassified Ruminococcus TaxID=2608920 RepID=UPI00210D8CE5|nr:MULTISPECIES: uridine phosphorylase [unclassified Ruminococcus]MCQ4021674.1 uridine phosphorylase [Ruminococcus sp. zg-924]MCQ4114119.1 uridine phosphorylase [Ruminococcus sp. zg-921]
MNKERQYHIALTKENSSKYAIICGAPERVEAIAAHMNNPCFVAQNREFKTFCGTLSGERVLVTSTGIGGPSAAIAIEELNHIGVDTIIRVGTCGGIQLDIAPGELVVASSAVRMDGTTKEYAPIEFPAAADYSVTSALSEACKIRGYKYKVGVVQSKDSFYGQHTPESTAISGELLNKWDAWKVCGVLASEMECSTLFVVSSIRKIRAGAVLKVIWNQERANNGYTDEESPDTQPAIIAAVKAMESIIISDKANG